MLAVDVVAFEGTPLAALDPEGADPAFAELVARAVVFRMTTDVLRGAPVDPAYRAVADCALARL